MADMAPAPAPAPFLPPRYQPSYAYASKPGTGAIEANGNNIDVHNTVTTSTKSDTITKQTLFAPQHHSNVAVNIYSCRIENDAPRKSQHNTK